MSPKFGFGGTESPRLNSPLPLFPSARSFAWLRRGSVLSVPAPCHCLIPVARPSPDFFTQIIIRPFHLPTQPIHATHGRVQIRTITHRIRFLLLQGADGTGDPDVKYCVYSRKQYPSTVDVTVSSSLCFNGPGSSDGTLNYFQQWFTTVLSEQYLIPRYRQQRTVASLTSTPARSQRISIYFDGG
jgi:hypothetical protein